MDGWRETGCDLSPNRPCRTVFDPYRDLVWVADITGRVFSYLVPYMKPYTSFVAHSTPVLDLQVTDKYVYSLSSGGVSCHKRTGQLKAFDPAAVGMRMLVNDNEILLATGRRVNRRTFDPPRETGTFTIDIPADVTILFMERCSLNVALGLSDGRVVVCDQSTFDIIYEVRCHSGPITDMDVCKSVIMTCGMSARRYGMVPDQIVYVYDARLRKTLPMLTLSSPGLFVRMHPKSPTNCVVVGPGQIQFMDVRNPTNFSIHPVASQSTFIGLDLSSQGDSLILLEQNGTIHFWTRNHAYNYTTPKNIELPDPPARLRQVTDTTPLSAVGMPPYHQELLSSWSDPLIFEVGMAPPQDFELQKRNTASNYVSMLKSIRRSSIAVPRFLSEQSPNSYLSNEVKGLSIQEVAGRMPVAYRQLQIHFSKFGVHDFDFSFYNKTGHAGLETQVWGNTFCNSLMQVMRWCAPLHNHTLQLFAKHNYESIPIVCELAMMFDMLHKAEGRPCRASNFMATLAAHPSPKAQALLASGLGLREQITGLFDFLMEQYIVEEESVSSEPSLHTVVGLDVTCRMYGSCGHRADTVERQMVLEAAYADLKGLNAALSRTTDMSQWCPKCNKQHAMAVVRQVTSASDVIFVSVQEAAAQPMRSPAEQFSLGTRADRRSFKVEDSNEPQYKLAGYIAEMIDRRDRHAVAFVKTTDNSWFLFNDFLVRPVEERIAKDFSPSYKKPLMLVYTRTDLPKTPIGEFDYEGWKQNMDLRRLLEQPTRPNMLQLTPEEIRPGATVALDAEFVLLSKEIAELHSDGTKSLIRPQILSLARVSVVDGNSVPPKPFIDDIVATTGPVLDYLTKFSGIEPGDLDPNTSPYPLVTRQTAIVRLWLLVNLGFRFVGHALVNDFRTINIQVPRNQVIDTVELFQDKGLIGPRKLSLKFLMWVLFDDQIQSGNHDSIEDAQAALKLYKFYESIKDEPGKLQEVLQNVYDRGQITGFRVPETVQ